MRIVFTATYSVYTAQQPHYIVGLSVKLLFYPKQSDLFVFFRFNLSAVYYICRQRCAYRRNTAHEEDYSTVTAGNRQLNTGSIGNINSIITVCVNIAFGKINLYRFYQINISRRRLNLDNIIVVSISVCLVLFKGGYSVFICNLIALKLYSVN